MKIVVDVERKKADQPRVEDGGTWDEGGGRGSNKLHPRTTNQAHFSRIPRPAFLALYCFLSHFRSTGFPMRTFLCRWILHTNLHEPSLERTLVERDARVVVRLGPAERWPGSAKTN